MAITPATGANVEFGDFAHWCTQDPTTKQWTGDSQTIAQRLNLDFRHERSPTVAAIMDILFSKLRVVLKNTSFDPSPANDQFGWSGPFDQAHRNADDSDPKFRLMRDKWNFVGTKGPASLYVMDCVPDYVPQDASVSDRTQDIGMVLAEWNELTQALVEESTYDEFNDWGYSNQPGLVYSAWIDLTGGRKFGAVSDDLITTKIGEQNARETRQLAYNATQDIRRKSGAAVSAADNEYTSNPNATAATVTAAGDAAYNAG